MIKNLRIKNFKCFEDMDIELSTLNILAGINSMGKSSVIQAILLLRQTYEVGAIFKGIHLNGKLTQIGTGYDLMNRNSDEDLITIELTSDTKKVFWEYTYDRDSDYQKMKNTNLDNDFISMTNLFNSNFSYVSAERIGPQRYYSKSYYEIYEKNQIGIRGELVVDYLAERGLKDKIVNKKLLHPNVQSDYLLYQTEGWLSEISPGIHLNPKKYQEAGIVGVEYNVSAENYGPTNVGFGLSYVTPIIVSLLKAQKGDLVILENPEAHLHPKGQRRMGELIARATADGVQVIVETHSDHLLNGIRLAVKNGIINSSSVRLNYFYQERIRDKMVEEKNIHLKCSPTILDDGRISAWPDGFFDEWDKALDELI